MDRFRALVAAVELVGAQGHDLDAVLDALAEQARRLLAADAATVLLTGPNGTLTVRRPNPLAEPGSPLSVAGESVSIGPLTREAIDRRHPVVAADFQQDERPTPETRAMLRRIKARVIVPLFTRDVLQGVLVLDWLVPHVPTSEDLEIAEALGAHAAVAIRGAQLVADAEARATRLETARRVSAVAAEAGDLDGLLRRLLSEALSVVSASRGQIALVDPDGAWIRGRVGHNLDPAVIEATVRRIYDAPHPEEDVYALVVRTGAQEIVGDDHPGIHRPTFERYGLTGQLRVITPIRHQGRTIGVIGIGYEGPTGPSDEELAVLRLIGEQAGSVVVRARLLDDAERARASLVSVLDAVEDTIVFFDGDGRVSAANAAARQQLVPSEGDGPAALGSLPHELIERALRGDRVAEEVVWTAQDGQVYRAHVILVPMPDPAGGTRGGVAVARDVTALHAATVQRAHLDAAVMTARTLAHELNQGLQLLTTYCELLAVTGGGVDPPLVDGIGKTVDRLADTVARFQRIARFQSVATPVGPALDLAAATTPPFSPEPP